MAPQRNALEAKSPLSRPDEPQTPLSSSGKHPATLNVRSTSKKPRLSDPDDKENQEPTGEWRLHVLDKDDTLRLDMRLEQPVVHSQDSQTAAGQQPHVYQVETLACLEHPSQERAVRSLLIYH
jgi:hypothetical protein